MGFLSGAYGKLMAGRYLRDLQHQLDGISRRHRQITREIGQKEKIYQAQERNMKQQMQAQVQSAMWGFLGMPMGTSVTGMTPEMATQLFGSIDTTKYSQAMQFAQMQCSAAQTVWQNMFEMQRDADLQALKDIEQDLQTEKESLESQIKIAEQEYQAKKDEEKQGAQNLKPDYTGQG